MYRRRSAVQSLEYTKPQRSTSSRLLYAHRRLLNLADERSLRGCAEWKSGKEMNQDVDLWKIHCVTQSQGIQ